jgi:hypothetical protein
MPLQPEYDEDVNRWSRATIAGLGLAVAGLLTASAVAQINAAPPSVTSMGFGGRAINGTPPSVTSLGPHGSGTSSGSGHHPHHHPRFPQGDLVYYATPYYGYYDNGTDPQNYAQNSGPEDEYNGGPTVLDRRGPGYIPPVFDPEQPADVTAAAVPAEVPPEPSTPTVLVFKDGHQLEVENYAIVGTTLYDLTEGHRRRVALGDLDLTATSQQNDDRGIDFHLPAGAEAN